MEMDSFLKARVSAKTKTDFEDICKELDVQPTTKLRILIEEFVKREYGRLSDRVSVHVYRPSHYQIGAWRVTMKLRDPTALEWSGVQVPFALPILPKRIFHPDDGYLAIVPKAGAPDDLTIGGKFADGAWKGDLYSNGIDEAENPTTIDQVRAALTETITKMLDRVGGSGSQEARQ